jgi:hypothetical protein
VDLSFEEMKNIRARDIYSVLVRETLNALPADSSLRSNPGSLGFSGQRNRVEVAARHRQGLHVLRQSRDVALALGCIENRLPEQRAMPRFGTNAAGWYAQAEPAFLRGSECFYGDRFAGILGLLDDVVRMIQQRYASQGVAPSAMLELARASVTAYGYGFFIVYNVEQMNTRQTENQSNES